MLSSRYAIYVPSTTDVDIPIGSDVHSQVVDDVMTRMSLVFGGATANAAVGAYVSDTGALVKERITVVYSYTTEHVAKQARATVYGIAQEIAVKLRQEAVTVETPDGLDFVVAKGGGLHAVAGR